MSTTSPRPSSRVPWIVTVILLGIALIGVTAFSVANLLSPWSLFSSQSSSRASEVVKYVLPQQKVTLASLRVEGIERADEEGYLLGARVEAADRTKYLLYSFDANLGIEGSQVSIEQVDEHSYSVMIPRFIFMGHSNEHFEDPIDNNQLLSFITKEISQSQMTNKILSDDKQDDYVRNSLETLRGQAQLFYGSIIATIDPDATVTFEFAQ